MVTTYGYYINFEGLGPYWKIQNLWELWFWWIIYVQRQVLTKLAMHPKTFGTMTHPNVWAPVLRAGTGQPRARFQHYTDCDLWNQCWHVTVSATNKLSNWDVHDNNTFYAHRKRGNEIVRWWRRLKKPSIRFEALFSGSRMDSNGNNFPFRFLATAFFWGSCEASSRHFQSPTVVFLCEGHHHSYNPFFSLRTS